MIVLYGRAEDPPMSMLVEALQDANTPYHFLDLGALDKDRVSIGAGPKGLHGTLVVGGHRVVLSEVTSVYARPLAIGNRWTSASAASAAQHSNDQFVAWLDVADALVVSRPRAMQSNSSKPYQIQLIAEHGFMVPATLVTSDEAEARTFWREHRRVVFKSCSGVRSIVQELDDRSAARLGMLATLPVQFQAYVEGTDVRVHVVGDRCFAAEISSTATDYRYAKGGQEVTLQAIELPSGVGEMCVALAQALDLPLAGIDLRRRPDGEHVCFEVNPMPAYSYFESQTGLPISRALAALLIQGSSHASHRQPDAPEREDHQQAEASFAERL